MGDAVIIDAGSFRAWAANNGRAWRMLLLPGARHVIDTCLTPSFLEINGIL